MKTMEMANITNVKYYVYNNKEGCKYKEYFEDTYNQFMEFIQNGKFTTIGIDYEVGAVDLIVYEDGKIRESKQLENTIYKDVVEFKEVKKLIKQLFKID